MKKRLLLYIPLALLVALVSIFVLSPDSLPGGTFLMQRLRGKDTISDRIHQYGPQVEARWHPYFASAGVSWPPQKLIMVGLKQEKQLEIYAANEGQSFHFIRSLPILAASGKLGPKQREGDLQVPEGVYHIESLNPNSAYHLALRISYPNDQDRTQAALEGRTDLGSDIMIHGSNASIGCLAMGDEAAEDLFVLASETGIEHIEVLLCPLDFRVTELPADPKRPLWVQDRYMQLKAALEDLPKH